MNQIKGIELFSYQKDSVLELLEIVDSNNGCAIFDETGLGKTITSVSVAINLMSRPKILVVSPKSNIKSWNNILSKTDAEYTVCTFSKIENGVYDVVIVDEAHNIRSITSKSYISLFSIINEQEVYPKVILLSATPFNNNFKELFAMFSLIRFNTNTIAFTTLGSIMSKILDYEKKLSVFDRYSLSFTSFKKIGEEVECIVMMNACINELVKVISTFSCRNTREYIRTKYVHDMQRMGMFPDIIDNPSIKYDTEYPVYQTIKVLDTLPLMRQNIMRYINPDMYNDSGFNGIYKSILMKRLDSSVSAFKSTVQKGLDELLELNKMCGSSQIKYVDIDVNVDNEFLVSIKKDIDGFKQILSMWADVDDSSKLNKLSELLSSIDGKTIIFTEYRDTLDIIKKHLDSMKLRSIVYTSDSKMEDLDKIIYEFDANQDKESYKNNYDILIATDVLSEGSNLHRAKNVIHYDSRWNPSRVIQRNGRVDRIHVGNTEKKVVNIYTFGIEYLINSIIKLEEKISKKTDYAERILNLDKSFNVKYRIDTNSKYYMYGMVSNEHNGVYYVLKGKNSDFSIILSSASIMGLRNDELVRVDSEFILENQTNFKPVYDDRTNEPYNSKNENVYSVIFSRNNYIYNNILFLKNKFEDLASNKKVSILNNTLYVGSYLQYGKVNGIEKMMDLMKSSINKVDDINAYHYHVSSIGVPYLNYSLR